MTLTDWITACVDKSGMNRTTIRERLASASGVSLVTIANVDNGMRLKNYDKAKALSDATKGSVTTEELCE